MADLFIFLAGLIVTTIVASAVFLLMWGAAHEPASGEPFEEQEREPREQEPEPETYAMVEQPLPANRA